VAKHDFIKVEYNDLVAIIKQKNIDPYEIDETQQITFF